MRAPEIEQPSVAHQEKDEDAPDKVVNMPASDYNPPKWPVLMSDETDQEPNADEGNQKGNRRDKHTTPRAIGDCGADQIAQASQLKKHQEQDYNQAGENQQ